jgi:hypothetical protein
MSPGSGTAPSSGGQFPTPSAATRYAPSSRFFSADILHRVIGCPTGKGGNSQSGSFEALSNPQSGRRCVLIAFCSNWKRSELKRSMIREIGVKPFRAMTAQVTESSTVGFQAGMLPVSLSSPPPCSSVRSVLLCFWPLSLLLSLYHIRL